MKRNLIIILFLFTGISSCKKNKAIITYSDSGTLTGFDPRLCACCGGIFLYSDYANTYYHIESLPGMSGADFGNLTFPKRIKYNWSIDRNCSGTVFIKITSYKFE